ncbi:MAG: penicillin-binding transpeptidase domain-containing protein, partial [Gemmatimonadota bacterium]
PPARLRQTQQTRLEELAQLAIGQGPVDITVVHISRFLQAIGNDGVMRSPSIEWDMAGESRRERIMSGSTARKLQAAMRDVVNRGTARGIRPELHGLDGWTLGGKTGTAQVAGARDDGWFTGLVFDPENKARFTVTVYLRGGGPGAAQPADIAAHLTRTLVSTAGWIVSR